MSVGREVLRFFLFFLGLFSLIRFVWRFCSVMWRLEIREDDMHEMVWVVDDSMSMSTSIKQSISILAYATTRQKK